MSKETTTAQSPYQSYVVNQQDRMIRLYEEQEWRGAKGAVCGARPGATGSYYIRGKDGLGATGSAQDETDKLRSQLASALQEIAAYRKVQAALNETIRVLHAHPPMLVTPSGVENPNEALQGKADEVIKGILGGKLPARKVDEIGEAVGKAKADRSVGRAIGAARLTVGLITQT